MTISLKPPQCCPLPTKANTATITDCDASVRAPYKRNECGSFCNTDPCCGSWSDFGSLRTLPNTFGTGDPVTIDSCGYGRKNLISKKFWTGRYGFANDYNANPKIDLHFTTYAVDVSLSFWEKASCQVFNSDGTNYLAETQESNSGSAHSEHRLTAGGLLDCIGNASAADGAAESHDSLGSRSSCYGYVGPISGAGCDLDSGTPAHVLEVPADYDAALCNNDQAGRRATNIAILKALCSIDGDCGRITVRIPGFYSPPIIYSGPAAGLGAFIAGLGVPATTTSVCLFYPEVGWEVQEQTESATYSLENFVFTNTGIGGTIHLDYSYSFKIWEAATHITNPDGSDSCTKGRQTSERLKSGSYDFVFSATLGGTYTFEDAEGDAKGLLATWDFTDDKTYPWQKTGDCRIAPMVSRWEINGSPGSGYCDTAADPAQTAIYDGSVKGAPIGGAPAYYSLGWFDYAMDFYNYSESSDSGDCASLLCYAWGDYVTNYTGVTMATQVVTGAGDTCACGAGWSPFSRYLVNWVLDFRPPFVDVSCAFVGDGSDAVYAAKWAEKKVPLPSQNYFGACGSQRSVTLLDSQCNVTATKRWPAAWSICGNARIASIARDAGTGVVTVMLTDAAASLQTGDAVDFLDAGNSVTTGNVTVTVDSANQFHFTGSLPTGVAIKSHGAPDPKWYDTTPKGDFVRASNLNGTVTVTQENLAVKGGIIFIGPPGSPEINNPKWPTSTTRIYSDYPTLAPTEHWYSSINQSMTDRFFTSSQDNSMNDGGAAGGACTALIPPATVPLVEARIFAPTGAPYNFSTGDGNVEQKMPGYLDPATNWSFQCSGVWNADELFVAPIYRSWPGVNTTPNNFTADQYTIGKDASGADFGLGTM